MNGRVAAPLAVVTSHMLDYSLQLVTPQTARMGGIKLNPKSFPTYYPEL